MRSNPPNNTREPNSRAALAIGAAALVVFGIGGLVINARTSEVRAENVRAAVRAAGYGEASVQPIKGNECWRAREALHLENSHGERLCLRRSARRRSALPWSGPPASLNGAASSANERTP